MAFTEEEITQLYVATFNRAPDAAGLNYWMNDSGLTSLEEVAESFFQSDEAQALYGDAVTTQEMVSAAYQNLFGREADTAGLDYWTDQIDSGNISETLMIEALIHGAQGNDATVLENKTTVGVAFAHSGENDVALAYDVIDTISDDVSTVEDALNEIETIAQNGSSSIEDIINNITNAAATGTDAADAAAATGTDAADAAAATGTDAADAAAATGTDAADAAATAPQDSIATVTTTLTESEVAGLLYMYEEEKVAMDVYDSFEEQYGSNIFANISDAEERHMDSVASFLEANNIDFSSLEALPAGEYSNEELQNLYTSLINQGQTSLEDALNVGVAVEVTDMADLSVYMSETTNTDLIGLYTTLDNGSQHHLDAFTNQLG